MVLNKSDLVKRVMIMAITEQIATHQIEEGMSVAIDFLRSKGMDVDNREEWLPFLQALDMVTVSNRSLGMSESAQMIFGQLLESDLIPDTDETEEDQEKDSGVIKSENAFYL